MRKMPGQPDSAPSSCLSQSSVLAKRLFTTRTTQTPPARASTLNSVAIGGEPGAQPSDSLANSRGGSQAVTTERDSMPGPNSNFTAPGFPPCSSNSAGTNQAEMPGPVAMACQTSSGVPGTSTSTWMERRPEASFFTLMLAPWVRVSAAEGGPGPPGDARGRGLVRRNRMSGGATPPTLLGRCRTNDHRPATGARERHAIASDGLVDQARDLRTNECGRALHVNEAHLAGGPLQQFRRIRQFLTTIEVQPDAVRARADCKNALVPAPVR